MADFKARRRRGFTHAGGLVAPRIRQGAHSRGFAEAKLLTQWEAIVGPEIARLARPKKVSYAKGGLGATLTLAVSGANAPVVAMQADVIRQRVNTGYGYNAISRVRIDQGAWVTGMAESQTPFENDKPQPKPQIAMGIENVNDEGLRDALARLAGNVLTAPTRREVTKKGS